MKDPRFDCPWCDHAAPIQPLLEEHKTRCPNRPEEDR